MKRPRDTRIVVPAFEQRLQTVIGIAVNMPAVRRAQQFVVIQSGNELFWRLAEDVELSDTVVWRMQDVGRRGEAIWKTTRFPLTGEKRALPDGTVVQESPRRGRKPSALNAENLDAEGDE